MATAERMPEVMTAEEVAEYLRVPEATIREQAARLGIPGRQVAGQWRFARAAIEEWLRGRSGKEVLLGQCGALQDDREDLGQLRESVFRERG